MLRHPTAAAVFPEELGMSRRFESATFHKEPSTRQLVKDRAKGRRVMTDEVMTC